MCLEQVGLHAQNKMTRLGSTTNQIEEDFNKNLHFEDNVRYSYKLQNNYEKSSYNLDLHLLTISY